MLFVVFALAKISFAATISAVSCSNTDVQTAIDTAVSGDTVLVPAGNCTWGDGKRIILSGNYAYPSISIDKSLSLIGSSTSILGAGSGYFIAYISPFV